jgi:hypothetical protein
MKSIRDKTVVFLSRPMQASAAAAAVFPQTPPLLTHLHCVCEGHCYSSQANISQHIAKHVDDCQGIDALDLQSKANQQDMKSRSC